MNNSRFAAVVSAIFLLPLLSSYSHADQWSFLRPAIDASQPKLVKIFGAGAGRIESYGTGILVSKEGHILTTQGGILDGARVRVLTADGSSYEASVLKRDRIRQLALLKIDTRTQDFFALSDISRLARKGIGSSRSAMRFESLTKTNRFQ